MTRSEVLVILSYLAVRGSLAWIVGLLLMRIINVLISELGGEDSDPAMTAILGGLTVALGGGFTIIIASISTSILDYLKDRLGTRGEAE